MSPAISELSLDERIAAAFGDGAKSEDVAALIKEAKAASLLCNDTAESARKRAVIRVVKEVAEYLGNTPAVCRSSYIDPRVIDLYDDGFTVATSLERLGAEGEFGQPATHGMVEAAVLRLLRKQALASRRRKPVSPVKAKAA